jgi:hypothetical protein
METLTVAVDDRLAVVTVGRPEVRDALTRQVLAELRDVLADLRERDDVGLVAVNGFARRHAAARPADRDRPRHRDDPHRPVRRRHRSARDRSGHPRSSRPTVCPPSCAASPTSAPAR